MAHTVEQKLLNRRLIVEETGCWEWTAYIDKKGYGRVHLNGKSERVHRVAAWLWLDYELDQPREHILRELVLHECNNRKCFNPEHIYIGNYQDNSNDMKKIGTNFKPTLRKLTDEDVLAIKRLLLEGVSHRKIAPLFNTNTQTVSNIRRGIMYKDVTEEVI